MPDVFQMSIDVAIKECEELKKLGIYSIILFGIPDTKDSIGSDALCENGIIAKAIREIKKAHPDMFVVSDLCFCEYTDHGHCGIIDVKNQTINNDATLEISAQQALIHAKAGVDMIAPSGMMDGIIVTLREALDENGYENLPIMSYSTKFSSGYYGPFRDVAESTPSFGDRSSYQMDSANRNEAIAESVEDEMQGADILMVKPALAYLDIVRDIKNATTKPLAVYNVSGEYAMLKFAAKQALIDYERVLMETMIAFKRAGASIIISYHAKEVARLLGEGKK
jgi:porphobilinogen synthase